MGFGFASPGEPTARFECRLDNGPFLPCTSPHTLTDLFVGEHAVEVRAIDTASNADTSPAAFGFTVVNAPPPPPTTTTTPPQAPRTTPPDAPPVAPAEPLP